MKSSIIAVAIAASLYSHGSYATPVTPLVIICTNTGVAPGAVMGACKEDQQKYDYPFPNDLIRWCPLTTSDQCKANELRWQVFSVLDDTQKVDGCQAPPIEPGVPLLTGGCADWEQLPKSQYPSADFFLVTPISGNAPLTVLLKWRVSAVDNCVASGDWSGNQGAQGEKTVVVGVTSNFKLACSSSASTSGKALISWTPPTQNVDNTPLTNLAGYRIVYGLDKNALSQVVAINNPNATNYTIDNLSPQLWFFAVKAVNSLNAESDPSNVPSLQVKPTVGKTWSGEASVQVTGGTPLPKAPTAVIVK